MNQISTFASPDFVPNTPEELIAACQSWEWRIFSGQVYKIMVKSDENDTGFAVPFIPNRAQRRFLSRLHYRNVILKARQLGFTTLLAVLFLDHALWNANQRCGIIAHELDAAEAIFNDKVVFAYENMPEALLEAFPLSKKTAKQLTFAHNNSSMRVATSMRSGTIHRLHVSELGKIAAKYPGKAKEIITGSLPAVPVDGIAVIESTSEGQEGEFYNIATKAEALFQIGRKLTAQEWRFHFFPWHDDPNYTADPSGVTISPADAKYFAEVEAITGKRIGAGQRAWYVLKRENDFSGDAEKMWQEMPSTSEECWRKSTEGTYFAKQLARARIEGRITKIPHIEQVRVNTFWDIGAGDGTGIWLHQYIGTQHRFLRYIEGWGEGYAHYVRLLRETGYVFGGMFLPHDATQKRQMANTIAAPLDMLMELAPDWSFHVVPRVETIQHGIELTRTKFNTAWFDEEGCKEGLNHITLYRKKWSTRMAVWIDEPEKLEGHSEAADSFRQWAQGFDPALINSAKRPRNRTKGGMAI